MKDPMPINLASTETIRSNGWAAESRDADGHLTSCHAPFDGDDSIVEWIIECTARGETVTFFPRQTSGGSP